VAILAQTGESTIPRAMAKPVNLIRRRWAAVTASSALLLTAGCEQFQFPNPFAPEQQEAVNTLPPPPPRKPTPPAPAAVTPVPVRLPEPTAPTAPASGFDRLIGLDQPRLTALLGEPRQRAEAPPATIWRYLGQACELDVYFYFDLQSQAMRALHYEIRSHESREQPAQQCYDELVSERRARAEPSSSTDSAR
jgi:hypothetical protein